MVTGLLQFARFMMTYHSFHSSHVHPPRSAPYPGGALTVCRISALTLLIGACSTDSVRDAAMASNDTSSLETSVDAAESAVASRGTAPGGEARSVGDETSTSSGGGLTAAASHAPDGSHDTSSRSDLVDTSGDAAATTMATIEDHLRSDAGAYDAGGQNSASRDAYVDTVADAASDSGAEVTFPEGTPLVMLVIDGSSGVFSTSMYGGSTGFGEYPDVWEAMRGVLTRLAGETNVRFWPVVYRAEQTGACPNLYLSGTEPVSDNALLDGWLPPSEEAVTEDKQEGPLADALAVFIEKLLAYDHAGPKHLLFLGDGPPGDSCTFFDAPACNRDPVFGMVQEAYRAGIRTRMLNLGEEAGLEFAEDVSHAGNGERVISLQETAYCIPLEAVRSGKIDSEDYAAQYDYAVNWRDHVSGDYLPDGEAYAEVLSHSPTDAASLTDAVQSYVQWVKEAL